MDPYQDEPYPFPRRAVRFPIEVRPPPGFRYDQPSTWPKLPGRFEYVGGRLLFMTPCGDVQQTVCFSVIHVIGEWLETRTEFVGGGNEAGMLLGSDARGADAAVWLADSVGPYTGGYRRVPPVLAVEVAGVEDEEGEDPLREKARWYLEHGVQIVWLVLPDVRQVVVLHQGSESRHGENDRLPAEAALPGLEPEVARFFKRLPHPGH
ncbi:MAG: Uma2 family endonuclease [Myxococcaceae bacterium]